MEEFDVYRDISERTDGDIYIGVVGPVRVGKSTFITNFMNKLVMPKIKSKHVKERMTDELPQSANGKAIMTTQPKFVPGEAVTVSLGDKTDIRIRLVDCVGYLIDGATGHLDDDKPRMVKTPWSDDAMPFEEAAETGTRKVIAEHSTIGIVMTSDGSIDTEIARAAYVPAEERVINELKELGKPFAVVLNSKVPQSAETQKLAAALKEKYGTPVVPLNALELGEEDIKSLLGAVLMEFPLRDVDVKIDKWLQALPADNEIVRSLAAAITERVAAMNKMSDYTRLNGCLDGSDNFEGITLSAVELGKGKVTYEVKAKPELFYKALSSSCGMEIDDDFTLMSYMKDFVHAKREYDRLKTALDEVKRTGYGVVAPAECDMTLEEPQIVRQGSRFGVKLRATAPSLHIMQVDVSAEVSPVMGAEMQSEEMVKNVLSSFDGNPKGIWDADMFGKPMRRLVGEGLETKLASMPEDAQKKMRRTLTRIVNEGKGGVICILL